MMLEPLRIRIGFLKRGLYKSSIVIGFSTRVLEHGDPIQRRDFIPSGCAYESLKPLVQEPDQEPLAL